MNAVGPTRVALLTPPGRAAIATVLIHGPEALPLVARYFTPARGAPFVTAAGEAEIDRPRYGRWQGPAGEELVVCPVAPTAVEIHCHGGVAAAAAIIAALVAGGAVASDPQEVALLAEPDPIRRAALEALVHARTERTASILLDQAEGALRRELAAALAALAAGDETVAASRLDELLRHARLGGRLVEPFRVVLVGAPNAGKSSLVNALMGFQRSIVHAQPGTTRDLVTATTALEGWPVELIDTAGLREADDPLEQAGIARAVDQSHGADLVLLVIDRSRNDALPAFANRAGWAELVVVHNKCDLPPGGRERDPSSQGLPCCLTSATTGEGIERLMEMIAARLVPSPPQPGAAVPFTANQVEHLQQARQALRVGQLQQAQEILASMLSVAD